MVEPPVSRRLRILAFDPSLATRLETATINEITVAVPWERRLRPGPVGEYVEVVDSDPASGVVYAPVDLNGRHVLAQDGLAPSESDPQFHQQMVYAVAMTTIRHFERALGRVALWADRRFQAGGQYRRQFVRRLRIYPHALRDRNAYYSPEKKALLFGYFPVTRKDVHNTPGTLVFTCLSHDIIAHEVTHALLDGVHPRFNEPTNADVHAFHEAFADIVALFQHFTYPAVLESQIRRTRGDLHSESLLAQLAQQFGRATGRGSALRDALGRTDEATGAWTPRRPDPHALEKVRGPHERGAVLVAAVFRAFLLMYRARTADLFRLASQGTGVLPAGDIHPDLTQRLAREAAACADRVLQMCIRAIDYCPPVDVTFGDFLRAVVTADLDYAPEDPGGFRVVFVESFREWGIYPRGVTSMGLDALVWPRGMDLVRDMRRHGRLTNSDADLRQDLRRFVAEDVQRWNLESNRLRVWRDMHRTREALWGWLRDNDSLGGDFARIFGLAVRDDEAPPTVFRKAFGPTIEVHAVRPAVRRTTNGTMRTDLVIEVTQRRRGYFDPAVQARADAPRGRRSRRLPPHDFVYRAGCTVLVDPLTAEVRRVIRTAGTIADDEALGRVREFIAGTGAFAGSGALGNAFDAGLAESLGRGGRRRRVEPFALLHHLAEE